jgi:hypothetical protein
VVFTFVFNLQDSTYIGIKSQCHGFLIMNSRGQSGAGVSEYISAVAKVSAVATVSTVVEILSATHKLVN